MIVSLERTLRCGIYEFLKLACAISALVWRHVCVMQEKLLQYSKVNTEAGEDFWKT